MPTTTTPPSTVPTGPEAAAAPALRREPLLLRLFARLDENLAEL